MSSGDATPERGSWRIVWRALRTGNVENPRYEALTRQTAESNVRNGWLLVLFAVVCALQFVFVVIRLVRGAHPSGTIATAGAGVFMAIGVGMLWVARRRSRRYLADSGSRHQSESQ